MIVKWATHDAKVVIVNAKDKTALLSFDGKAEWVKLKKIIYNNPELHIKKIQGVVTREQ